MCQLRPRGVPALHIVIFAAGSSRFAGEACAERPWAPASSATWVPTDAPGTRRAVVLANAAPSRLRRGHGRRVRRARVGQRRRGSPGIRAWNPGHQAGGGAVGDQGPCRERLIRGAGARRPAASQRGLLSVCPTSRLDQLALLLIPLEGIRYARRRAEIFGGGPQGDRPSGAFRVVGARR